ncbi:MAG: TonB-dependent receptor [Pseudomonadota bacterium]
MTLFYRRSVIALTSIVCSAMLVITSPVHAQNNSETVYEFDIAAQPLSNALIDFSRTTRRQVAADSDAIRNSMSAAVVGSMTAADALDQMLANSGLELVTVNGDSYSIRSATDGVPPLTQSEPDSYEEVLVTGTKQNLGLQDIQASVALFTAEDIEKQSLFNVEDIILRTANVSTTAAGELNGLSIRGISLGGVGEAGSGATSNVYVDGSPNSFNANQGAANLWDVGQVEILRGPQSTVQGRNALAGAVIINTADPVHEFGTDVRVIAGNEDNRQYSATVNLPLIEDELALRVSADYREIDFGVTNVDTGRNTRFQEALTARAKLLWEPSDELRIELSYQYTDTEFGEFNSVNAPGPAGSAAFEEFDPFGDTTFGLRERFEFNLVERYTADIQYELNDRWKLYALATYEDSQRDSDFGALGVGDAPDDTLSVELRASFDYGKLTGWLGAYYFDTDGSFASEFLFPTSAFGLPSIPTDASVIFDTTQEDATENRALFFDVTYEVNDSWTFNVAARYDEEDFTDTGLTGETSSDPANCILDPIIPGIGGLPCAALFPPPVDTPTTAKFDAFLPRVSAIYSFDEDRSLSFTIARGYRAGGSFLRAVPGEVPMLLDFEPEFLTNYELAFRSVWPEQNLTFNANLFYSDWEDQQISVPGPTGTVLDVLILNAGEAELLGLEMELRKEFSDQLEMFMAVGLVDTEFKNFPFAVDSNGAPVNTIDPTFANLAGNEFNSAPNSSLAIGLAYEADNGFFASGNLSYSSSQFSDVANLPENKVGSYTLVNLRAGYRWDNWSVAAFADNVFDERFAGRQGLSSVSTATGVVTPNQVPFFNVNDPRVVGVEIRYSY